MRFTYQSHHSIPELGVDPGDILVIRPEHPTSPLLVLKRKDRNRLPLILDHINRLELVSSDEPQSAVVELQRRLGSPPPRPHPRRHLRALP